MAVPPPFATLYVGLLLLVVGNFGCRGEFEETTTEEPEFNLALGLSVLEFGENDFSNHELMSKWFGEAFHSALRYDAETWVAVRAELDAMIDAALAGSAPQMAFATGSALYSYFWWNGDGDRIDLDAGGLAMKLLRASLSTSGCCDPDLSGDDFVSRQCQMRWRQAILVAGEVGRHAAVEALDPRKAASALRHGQDLVEEMRALPFFQQYQALGARLRRPHDVNYNMDHYPHVNVGPIWRKEDVPLAAFFEKHYEVFREELSAIEHADTFWALHRGAFVSETQFTPVDEDWQTVYLFLNKKFVDKNCEAAPRTCELLRSRPELTTCKAHSTGAGFLRLRPGARLKPHYGNGPRLSVHLGLRVPEVGDIHMNVGGSTVRWKEGRAEVFDDTFIHRVTHNGDEPRFVLLAWFCHPCDSDNWDNPPEGQLELCRWPR